jgi:hypothetical protein
VVGRFVVDRTTVGKEVVPQTVVTASGSAIQEVRRDVAERMAERHSVPVEPLLRRTRLGFLECQTSALDLVDRALTAAGV